MFPHLFNKSSNDGFANNYLEGLLLLLMFHLTVDLMKQSLPKDFAYCLAY